MIQAPWHDRLAEPLGQEHLVQLYREDARLVEAIALFAGRGLGKGESVVVIATEPHRTAVRERLGASGFDLGDLELWGRLTLIDAAGLLARVYAGGSTDAGAFEAIVGDVVAAARAGGRYPRVRLYGEMVNLLWSADHGAARRLEELWNAAIRRHHVSLLCAYRIAADAEAEGRFPADLRALHSHLIPVQAGG
ncbi:MAG TPA: MEDS domain-containing protein [Vicinamibacteria bacterium]|nr:MEDS domain-containing protein [Vicinamibacteria bacterium]